MFSFQSQKIINDHIEHRRQERYENPIRFNVKPTVGERSLRRPPIQPKQPTYETDKTLESLGQDGPHPGKHKADTVVAISRLCRDDPRYVNDIKMASFGLKCFFHYSCLSGAY